MSYLITQIGFIYKGLIVITIVNISLHFYNYTLSFAHSYMILNIPIKLVDHFTL